MLKSQPSLPGKCQANERLYVSKINKNQVETHEECLLKLSLIQRNFPEVRVILPPHLPHRTEVFILALLLGGGFEMPEETVEKRAWTDPAGAVGVKGEKVNRPTKHNGRKK